MRYHSFKNNKFFEEQKNEEGDITNNHERYYFLLIRRKDTLGYVEFLRGKYDEMNEEYLVKIFNTMTSSEIDRIKTLDFEQYGMNYGHIEIINNIKLNLKILKQSFKI